MTDNTDSHHYQTKDASVVIILGLTSLDLILIKHMTEI